MKKFLTRSLLIFSASSVIITGVFIYGLYLSDNDYYDKEKNPYVYAHDKKAVKGIFKNFKNTVTHAEGYEIDSIVIDESEYESPDQFIWDIKKRIDEVKGDEDLKDLTGGIIVYSNYFLQNKKHLSMNGSEFKELHSAAKNVYEAMEQDNTKEIDELKNTINDIHSYYFGNY